MVSLCRNYLSDAVIRVLKAHSPPFRKHPWFCTVLNAFISSNTGMDRSLVAVLFLFLPTGCAWIQLLFGVLLVSSSCVIFLGSLTWQQEKGNSLLQSCIACPSWSWPRPLLGSGTGCAEQLQSQQPTPVLTELTACTPLLYWWVFTIWTLHISQAFALTILFTFFVCVFFFPLLCNCTLTCWWFLCHASGSSHQRHAVQLSPGAALRPAVGQRLCSGGCGALRVQRRLRTAGLPQHRVPHHAWCTGSVECLCTHLCG